MLARMLGRIMATTSPGAQTDFGPIEVGETDLDGYKVAFLHVKQRIDMNVMLRGLPDDRCPCPHWGVVTEGSMTVRYADHQEVVGAGDVFYMPPGHVPTYEPGTRPASSSAPATKWWLSTRRSSGTWRRSLGRDF